jgi:hypothetical protein
MVMFDEWMNREMKHCPCPYDNLHHSLTSIILVEMVVSGPLYANISNLIHVCRIWCYLQVATCSQLPLNCFCLDWYIVVRSEVKLDYLDHHLSFPLVASKTAVQMLTCCLYKHWSTSTLVSYPHGNEMKG